MAQADRVFNQNLELSGRLFRQQIGIMELPEHRAELRHTYAFGKHKSWNGDEKSHIGFEINQERTKVCPSECHTFCCRKGDQRQPGNEDRVKSHETLSFPPLAHQTKVLQQMIQRAATKDWEVRGDCGTGGFALFHISLYQMNVWHRRKPR